MPDPSINHSFLNEMLIPWRNVERWRRIADIRQSREDRVDESRAGGNPLSSPSTAVCHYISDKAWNTPIKKVIYRCLQAAYTIYERW